MQKRYLLVEAVDGLPVADPKNPMMVPPRLVGWRLKDEEHPDPEHMLDHYQREAQVHEDHPHLRGAAKDGELKILKDCVARGLDEARSKLQPQPAPQAPTKSAAASSAKADAQ